MAEVISTHRWSLTRRFYLLPRTNSVRRTCSLRYYFLLKFYKCQIIKGYPGVQDAFGFILSLAIPPVVKYAEESLKQKVIMEVTKGEKIICLAITDPL
jgi:hypothetical protein